MINPDIKFNPIFSAQHKIITLDADHKHMRNVVKLELVRQTPPMYSVQREVGDMYVLLFNGYQNAWIKIFVFSLG